ncbi:hypothetical protein Ais01nite_47700 [Asanoa ishikariensis]|nr:hypothetical protein Ais01nite_47700 [Asanoa ishikariensis]
MPASVTPPPSRTAQTFTVADRSGSRNARAASLLWIDPAAFVVVSYAMYVYVQRVLQAQPGLRVERWWTLPGGRSQTAKAWGGSRGRQAR